MTDDAAPATTAAGLLERAEAAWPRFASAVRHVGLRHLDEATPSGWRYRDVVAHAAVWHRICVEGVDHVIQHGRRKEGPFPSVDEINAEAARSATGVDPERLVHDLEASWSEARTAIARLTDDHVRADDGWVASHVAANTWEHYDEHLPELRVARPATVEAFLARLDDDWSDVRAAIETLGPDGLERPTGKGWRYRDLVAHASGWLLDAEARLSSVRADPDIVFEAVDVDAFNAASLEARRAGSADELLRELDSAYRTLRHAVGDLRDEELADRRISGFLAARSYLHVDEHLDELRAARR